jgi:DnaJ-class molecular chaperone
MGEVEQQHDGVAPLLEPAVLVSDNCERCRGTGFLVPTGKALFDLAPWDGRDPAASDVPNSTVPCPDCGGTGRLVREVALSEFVQMAGESMSRYRAPSPSELRGG